MRHLLTEIVRRQESPLISSDCLRSREVPWTPVQSGTFCFPCFGKESCVHACICVCTYMSTCVSYYFLSILFDSLSKCLISLSCVPGTVPGTASENKVASALKELTLWDHLQGHVLIRRGSQGSCVQARRQAGGGEGECQQNSAVLQRSEQAMS